LIFAKKHWNANKELFGDLNVKKLGVGPYPNDSGYVSHHNFNTVDLLDMFTKTEQEMELYVCLEVAYVHFLLPVHVLLPIPFYSICCFRPFALCATYFLLQAKSGQNQEWFTEAAFIVITLSSLNSRDKSALLTLHHGRVRNKQSAF
jgi:hypothetical protein